MSVAGIVLIVHLLLIGGFIVRVLLRPYRDPASRMAWIVVILVLPGAGIVAYLLFGEVNIGRRRLARIQAVFAELSVPGGQCTSAAAGLVPEQYAHLFQVGQSISDLPVVGGTGNRHWSHGAQLGHARDVRIADACRPRKADDKHALLCTQRINAGDFVCHCLSRR